MSLEKAKTSAAAAAEKDLPGASSDGIFQYNQPLTWFNTTTNQLINGFLDTVGIDMFFPKSIEYELCAYCANCLDYTATHAYSSVRRFNSARIANLAAAKDNRLEEAERDRLDYVCEKWDEARLAWIAALDAFRSSVREQEEMPSPQNEQGEPPSSPDELQTRAEAIGHTFSDLLISIVLAALYTTFVSRLHLTNFVHDNFVLLYFDKLFRSDSEGKAGTQTGEGKAGTQAEWYAGFKSKLFDMGNADPESLLPIAGKLKNEAFVKDYFDASDDKERAAIINKNGALTHENYYLGDLLLDFIFFLWKHYQTYCCLDDSLVKSWGDQEKPAGARLVDWLPASVCLDLSRRVRYSPGRPAPHEATNEKNIISILGRLNPPTSAQPQQPN